MIGSPSGGMGTAQQPGQGAPQGGMTPVMDGVGNPNQLNSPQPGLGGVGDVRLPPGSLGAPGSMGGAPMQGVMDGVGNPNQLNGIGASQGGMGGVGATSGPPQSANLPMSLINSIRPQSAQTGPQGGPYGFLGPFTGYGQGQGAPSGMGGASGGWTPWGGMGGGYGFPGAFGGFGQSSPWGGFGGGYGSMSPWGGTSPWGGGMGGYGSPWGGGMGQQFGPRQFANYPMIMGGPAQGYGSPYPFGMMPSSPTSQLPWNLPRFNQSTGVQAPHPITPPTANPLPPAPPMSQNNNAAWAQFLPQAAPVQPGAAVQPPTPANSIANAIGSLFDMGGTAAGSQ